ncbi:ogr/Delta-like zinc finger family protein [Sphingomonas sp. UV9]|uniref:ogr/Delta-like zinc finger family protein n=1 Tax=Sphingomonas sp. UV9 TaxID=1851410 RepID=UPI001F0BB310|nr:ogr/Delta-like zinc finger family protein [Sphingomonas sp. UV9]
MTGRHPSGGHTLNQTSNAAYSGKRITIGCPHCQSVLKVRSSRQTDPIVRQVTLACQNDNCCATFGADLTLTHVISAGAQPNPAVLLRTTPPRRRPANDDMPPCGDAPGSVDHPPANDDGALPTSDAVSGSPLS